MGLGTVKFKNFIPNDFLSMSLRVESNDRREFYSTKQSLRGRQEIASSNILRFAPNVLLAMTGMLLISLTASAQSPKPLDMHGLRPGMSTAEIFLYAHAPLDTLQWGGTEAANVIAFNGIYLNDTGQFRVNTTGPDIMRVNFIAKQRSVEQNGAAYHRAIEKITKLLGKPYQDYHNKYRIITWNAGAEQLALTTADGGKFYSVALSGGSHK